MGFLCSLYFCIYNCDDVANVFRLGFETSFSAVAATINNLGPGLGEVVNGYNNLSDFNKWLLLSMIVGRLEVFTLLVILTPEFWRK